MRIERALIRRFPSRWREIIALCEENELFRSLCADYGDAWRAAKLWSKSGNSPERAEEYREVALQIESEIFDELRKNALSVPSDNELGAEN